MNCNVSGFLTLWNKFQQAGKRLKATAEGERESQTGSSFTTESCLYVVITMPFDLRKPPEAKGACPPNQPHT